MNGKKVLIDTGIFKGLIDKDDQYYEDAKHLVGKLTEGYKLMTTNFILDETITLIRKKCGVYKLKGFVALLENNFNTLEVIRVTIRDEEAAWKWIFYDWKDLSFTDCVSFAVIKRLGIEQVATFDEHFELAGFEVVSKDKSG